jgi:hypothetical protein
MHRGGLLQHLLYPDLLFVTSVWNTHNVLPKHLKHLKCTLAICIVSWCGLLRHLHRGTTSVARGEAEGLPCQGPTLLLALAALVDVIRWGGQRSRSSGADDGAGTGAAGWAHRAEAREARRATGATKVTDAGERIKMPKRGGELGFF